MVLEEFWSWLEATPLAAHIGESAWFPFLESVHVLTAMFVVGTVLMADLRLLGWAGRRYPVTVITSEARVQKDPDTDSVPSWRNCCRGRDDCAVVIPGPELSEMSSNFPFPKL